MSAHRCSLILATLCLLATDAGAAGAGRRLPATRRAAVLEDIGFHPTLGPSLEGVGVQQVVVTSDALAAAFEPFADHETFRGVPTVVRTTSWIDAEYSGPDRAARIRTFLRDAHDLWGTEYAVLGGDVEHVPTRYVPWGTTSVPSDLYYECLDREWNEDGDARYAEPLVVGGLESFVSDVDFAPDGKLWFGTNVGACTLEGGQFGQYREADGLPSDRVLGVDAAPDNAVWIRTLQGVARWNGSTWTAWTSGVDLPGTQVLSVLAVAVNDAWVGTNGGLAHWNGASWATWTVADGLPDDAVVALALDGADLWVGTVHGAARFSGGTFTVYDVAGSGILSDWVLSIAVQAPGVVWFGHDDNFFTQGGFSRFDGTWTTDDLPAYGGLAVRDLRVEPGGEIWAATPDGLFHRSGGGDELLGGADGLAGDDVQGVARGALVAVGGADGLTVGLPSSWTVHDAANGLPAPVLTWDDVDLVPDLAVGRIPATDAAEVAVYLTKLFAYRNGVDASRADEALFLGEMLFEDEDGKMYCEEARDEFPASFSKTELYESDGTQNVATTLAALNDGPGWVVQVGHGSYDAVGSGPDLELLFNHDFDGIDSAGRLAFYVVYSCHSGAFDQDCSMEHALFNPDGGAIATMANSRSAIAGVDATFNVTFWQRMFASAHGQPVLAMHEARDERYSADPESFEYESWWRRTYLSRSFLGPPTLSLWRAVPTPIDVAHPGVLPAGRSDVTVVVTESPGVPVPDALVCLSKGVEDYAYGRTDASGSVTFDFRPQAAGLATVRVSAPDRLPYEGSISVSAPTTPLPVAAGWQPGGASLRSTAMTLSLALQNVGTAAAAGWSVELSSAEPLVTVTSGLGTLPALGAGQTGWTSDFGLSIDPGLPDDAPIRLVLEGTGPTAFTEEWVVPARSAGIRLVRLHLVGDFVIPEIENAGVIGTGPVAATLVLYSGTGSVTDGNASISDIPPGASYLLSDAFVVTAPSSSVFQLTVTDSAGHLLTQLVDREAPAGVTGLRATPRDGGTTLEWTPSVSPDVVGCRVWGRSPAAARSAWEPELGGAVLPSGLVDVDFDEPRELLVLAVDRSGLTSPDSAFVVAYPALPTLPGWPVHLGSILGPASVAVVDLDGDDSPEVVVGSMWESNAIHVFRAGGTEWTDGDADPSTPGIFGQAADRVLSPPLVVDVDGDLSREIFAGSYDGYVHAWRTNGPPGPPPVVPGWPIYQAYNGVRSAPALADLDGDGDPEIVLVVNQGTVNAFHVDGTPVAGWPVVTPLAGLGSSPCIHDFDGDGDDDVVFGATDSSLYVVRGDGTALPGWPVKVGAKIQSSPVLIDADGDGDYEIFALDRDGVVWAYQHDDGDAVPGPDPLAGWPVATIPVEGSPPSPAVGDFDDDGSPELVVAGDGEIAVLRMDGTPFPGTPILTGAASVNSPVVADLDGDGSLDILSGTEDFRLTAWAIDGTVLPGWPRTFTEAPASTPYVADVDGDGDLDVALGANDAWLRIVDAPGPAIPGAAPWPGYQGVHDARGKYVHVRLGTPAPDPAALPASVVLGSPVPNPFRTGTSIRFALPRAGPVRLDVFDVAGRRVATPLDGPRPAGVHVLAWNGTDASGRPVAAGVYFVRLQAGGTVRAAKVLRLR